VKLGIKDGLDRNFVKEAIYTGNAWGLKWRYPSIFDMPETSDAVRVEAMNMLDMWSFIEWGYEALSAADKARVAKEAAPLGEDVRFRGFDENRAETASVHDSLTEVIGEGTSKNFRCSISGLPFGGLI
jgi:uncharacterized protein